MAVRGRVALLAAGLILSGAEDKSPTRAVACERRPGACCDFLPWDCRCGDAGAGGVLVTCTPSTRRLLDGVAVRLSGLNVVRLVHKHAYADADLGDDAPSGGATVTPSRFRNPSMSSSKHRS